MAVKSLPLGLDIGASRLRIVASVVTQEGARLQSVATRNLSEGVATSGQIRDVPYVAAVIEEAWSELQVREKRCVLSVGEPDGLLRLVEFPKMTSFEREKAAAFEAQRYIAYPIDEAVVRVHPVDEKQNVFAIGVVRESMLRSRVQAARAGGLKVVAVDHESLAFGRALPDFDAVIDIGLERTAVHLLTRAPGASVYHAAGGAAITRGIERELAIDPRSAEKRKRILGTVGGGESARSAFLADLTALLENSMSRSRPLSRVALCGNGARLNGFAADLERATGLLVEIAPAAPMHISPYPSDVIRAGAPDWNLAAGLSLWEVAAR